jgi:autotransporter-associated beta strand protein
MSFSTLWFQQLMVLSLEIFMSKQRVKKSFIYRLGFLCMATAILLMSSSVTQAVVYDWGLTSGDWSDPNSWNIAGVPSVTGPTSADNARIANGGTINITQNELCTSVTVGNTGTLPNPTGTGYVNMTAGIITESLGGSLQVGLTNNGTFDQSGGTFNTGLLGVTIGGGSSSYSGVIGTYHLSGTGALVSGSETIGQYATGNFIQDGGSNLAAGKPINLGSYNGGIGTYTLNDGTVGCATMTFGANTGSTGIFKQNGGTLTITSTAVTPTGLNLASGAGSTGTFNLNGGTLILQVLKKGSGTATFNFGGGTLKPNAALTSSLNMNLSGIGSDPLLTYNATVDTAGLPVTLSGILSGVGGLNKKGEGNLKLNGANTYTGLTDVMAGSLGGSGTLAGAVKVESGARLAPGDPATFTVGDITFNDGSYLDIAFVADLHDKLVSTGTLTIGSNVALNVTLTGAPVIGDYDVLDWVGKSGEFSTVNLPDLSAYGMTDSYNSATGVISIVPEPATLVLLITACLAMLGYAGRRYRQKNM